MYKYLIYKTISFNPEDKPIDENTIFESDHKFRSTDIESIYNDIRTRYKEFIHNDKFYCTIKFIFELHDS